MDAADEQRLESVRERLAMTYEQFAQYAQTAMVDAGDVAAWARSKATGRTAAPKGRSARKGETA